MKKLKEDFESIDIDTLHTLKDYYQEVLLTQDLQQLHDSAVGGGLNNEMKERFLTIILADSLNYYKALREIENREMRGKQT